MTTASRLAAALAYIPLIGWLYVYFFQRQNLLALFHLRQSVGLFLFLIATLAGWGVVAWIVAWVPYLAVLSIALFAIVIVAYFYGVLAWILGLINALRNRLTPLPGFGRWANRLPIK
jgi:uncharacterized membrane protein